MLPFSGARKFPAQIASRNRQDAEQSLALLRSSYYVVDMFGALRQSLISSTRVAALVSVWALAAAPSALSAQDLRLLMIERPGCYYCVVFKRDVAPIYHKSPEGQVAPLEHADLRYPLPDGVTLASRAHVTPTFILLDGDGNEVERLIGYPGDDFFWPYVNAMIARALPAEGKGLAP